jgi:hypothetical protein
MLEGNIKTDLGGREQEGIDWMHLAQDRDHGGLVNMVKNLQVP